MRFDSQDHLLRDQMEYFCLQSILKPSIHEECLLLVHRECRVERRDGVVVLALVLLESCLVVQRHRRTVAVRSAKLLVVHLVE